MTSSHRLAIAASALVLVGAAGCGGAGSTQSAGAGAAAADDAPSVTITSPQNGAMVGSTLPLMFKTSVPIGPLETGKDHVHVVVDGDTQNFQVVTAHKTMVKQLSPGKHTVGVTLQHADHSSAGAQDQITVTVGKAAGTGGDTSAQNSGGNSYGSGY